MPERYDIKVGPGKPITSELRGQRAAGGFVVLEDGTEAEIVRVLYPLGRRVVLECKAKPEVKEAPKAKPVEVKEEVKDEPKAETATTTFDKNRKRT